MKDCVRYAPMLGAREGELTKDEQRALDAHVETCADCRAIAANLAALDGLVGESLMARANARDFAPFVDQVMARVGTEGGAPARVRRGFLGWLFAHPRAAIASVVPVLAAVALVVYVRSGSGGSGEMALREIATEGDVTMVLQTKDGPVVLLDDGEQT
jgi:anti-sigma factor RsiW